MRTTASVTLQVMICATIWLPERQATADRTESVRLI